MTDLKNNKNKNLAVASQNSGRLKTQSPAKSATHYRNRTSVIIPCYNEADRLHLELFLNFARENPDISFVFVDDGSKDLTINLLCGAMAALPAQVDVLMMARNAGKAEAVRHGLKFAAHRGDKYIAFLDADLATPLNAINDFISVANRLDNIDVVFGSRAGGLGHKVYREIHRKIISLICASMGRMATGLALKDTQCGAKLFRNSEHLQKCLDVPFSAGWLFDVELFLRISNPNRQKRENFFEYPVLEWTEIPGSKIKFKDVIKGGVSMTSLILNQWKIRQDFQDPAFLADQAERQYLRAGAVLDMQALRAMETIISEDKRGVTLDFTAVTQLSPSIFTSLIEICEILSQQDRNLSILLPDDAKILAAAQHSSLTALYECYISKDSIGQFSNNDRFELAAA